MIKLLFILLEIFNNEILIDKSLVNPMICTYGQIYSLVFFGAPNFLTFIVGFIFDLGNFSFYKYK